MKEKGGVEVNGSCHCGAIAFEARIDPRRVGICHCVDCQIFSGSAFRTSARVRGRDFRLVQGEPAVYEKTAESGARRRLGFCSHCGTHLYGLAPAGEEPIYSVRVGTLAQRAEIRPAVQIWCRSEVSWLSDLQALRRIATQ
jgi:hypothetical protein